MGWVAPGDDIASVGKPMETVDIDLPRHYEASGGGPVSLMDVHRQRFQVDAAIRGEK